MNAEIESRLLDRGWAVIDLPDPAPVHETRERLLRDLRELYPTLARLEDYHAVVGDEQHIAVMHRISQNFWDARLGVQIVAANLEIFRSLIGPDLHVQQYPYLRAVRPGRSEDAVPLHRDTYYGASPFEISVVVPLTDMEANAALRAVPGSHMEGDAAYPFVQTVSDTVAIGSARHQLGYAYAPRLLDPSLDQRTQPMPAEVGQALIFGLSLVHGGGVNSSERTRFSIDVRVVNSLAPVSFSRGVREDYYVPLCASPVSRSARRFLKANEPGDGGPARPSR